VVFVAHTLLEGPRPDAPRTFAITHYFALSLDGLSSGFIWQVVTFQFLHAGLLHIIVNLIVIYFFGRALEEVLGRRPFLVFYLSAGVAGGLLQMLFAGLLPAHFGGSVVGASAGAFGLVAAFAAIFPERQITLLLFFIIPVSMRAKTLLWLALGMAVLGMIAQESRIAHAAHLGGIFAGLIYVSAAVQGRGWSSLWGSRSGPSWKPPARGRSSRAHQDKPIGEMSSAEFMTREVDPILEKISKQGIHSLTEGERKILEAARNRMAKR
jgi:membrane associated rhomboid family serine protease